MRILVTGAGGDIGFGAGRILRRRDESDLLYGVDIKKNHPGSAVFNFCDVAPSSLDPNYSEWLTDYVEKKQIDLVLPTTEQELARLSEDEVAEKIPVPFLMLPRDVLRTCLDKHVCMQYLKSTGTVVPTHGLVCEDVPKSLPIVVKPRRGRGSQSVRIIRDECEMTGLPDADLVWQEYLDPADQEFTCAVYRSPAKEICVLLMQRTLVGGLTGYGEVVCNSEIDAYVREIANLFEFSGAMNIQLRNTKDGPVLFEINPRLSSTLVFRDKMGFCDLRWWLEDSVGIGRSERNRPLHGTKFYRGSCEYIFEPS